jgi:hypothetical protein
MVAGGVAKSGLGYLNAFSPADSFGKFGYFGYCGAMARLPVVTRPARPKRPKLAPAVRDRIGVLRIREQALRLRLEERPNQPYDAETLLELEDVVRELRRLSAEKRPKGKLARLQRLAEVEQVSAHRPRDREAAQEVVRLRDPLAGRRRAR